MQPRVGQNKTTDRITAPINELCISILYIHICTIHIRITTPTRHLHNTPSGTSCSSAAGECEGGGWRVVCCPAQLKESFYWHLMTANCVVVLVCCCVTFVFFFVITIIYFFFRIRYFFKLSSLFFFFSFVVLILLLSLQLVTIEFYLLFHLII